MDALIAGYRRFRAGAWRERRDLFESLAARGQSPLVMVVTCSDSRVDPQMVFDAAPGELFVVRNVANLVPAYAPDAAYHGTSAALEFAVRALEVRHIVVMGHAFCGGVRALLEDMPSPAGDFIGPWMAIAGPARDRALALATRAPGALQRACEHECAKESLANLATFPWVRERVEVGTLALHGCWFDLETGELLGLGPDGKFRPV